MDPGSETSGGPFDKMSDSTAEIYSGSDKDNATTFWFRQQAETGVKKKGRTD